MSSQHINEWKSRNTQALLGGGPQAQERQLSLGKNIARKRISLLVDPDSFMEIDQLASSPIISPKVYTDGVIAGFGTIDGKQVALYAQDFTIKGGSLGKLHAEKICKVMDMAAKIGCPIIGIVDSGGARIEEGIHALEAYGQIFKRNARYSGVIPQISIIMGPCAGGATYSPSLTDFIFMTESTSQMFITGPQVIAEVVHQIISKEELGGASVHASMSGVTHSIAPNEEECFEKVKALLTYLPSSYMDSAPTQKAFTNPTTTISVPDNHNQPYNIKDVIASVVDLDSFFELQESFAACIVTGFARLYGNTIGIIANQPAVKAGTIDIDASCKAARFIQWCDSFGIPLVTLVDTPGYLPGIDQEHNGIIRHGAKLAYAYATSTVPKITLILRKAFGGAYIVMGSKSLGTDFNFAWPNAQIAVLGAKAAVSVIHAKKLAGCQTSEDKAVLQKQYEDDYTATYLNPFIAAENGYIDAIIAPEQTREHLAKALLFIRDKVEKHAYRKHGNQPL